MGEEQQRLFELPSEFLIVEGSEVYRVIHVKEHWRKIKVKGDADAEGLPGVQE